MDRMKGISCCGDCVYYSMEKHECTRCDNIEGDPRAHFYEDCPLPDAEPVVHGHWLKNVLFYGTHTCSNCGKDPNHFECATGYVEILSDYCPNCGAKMDGCRNEE